MSREHQQSKNALFLQALAKDVRDQAEALLNQIKAAHHVTLERWTCGKSTTAIILTVAI